MRNEKTKKEIRILIIVVSILIITVLSLMIIGNAWYTVYFLDDFNHSSTIGAFHVGFFEYLKASIVFAKLKYMTWQGTYSSMFLQGLLSPLNNGGLSQLRIVMLINALLFLSSFLIAINTVIRYLNKDIGFETRIAMMALVYLQLFTSLAYPEVFSWFSGATCYSFPLSFLFLSISFALISEEKKKVIFLMLSMFFGFWAMGGVLGITGMGCAFMLVLIVIPLMLEKKIKKYLSIVFVSYMVFAIFAVIAPGNFLRRGYVDTPINPVKAAFLSCKKLLYGGESLFKDTGIIVIVLLFIVIGLIIGKLIDYKDLKKYVCISLLMILVPLATLFPIILGYGGYEYFPNRCTFLLNITLTLWILNLSLMVGILLNKFLGKEESIKITSIVIVLIAFTCLIVNGNRFEDNVAVKQIGNLANGRIKTFYTECNNMLREIETSPDEDVVLERNPYSVENFAEFYLSDDETFGYNVDIANYYHKKSVRIKGNE